MSTQIVPRKQAQVIASPMCTRLEWTNLCMEFSVVKTQNKHTRRAYLTDLRTLGDSLLRQVGGELLVDMSDVAFLRWKKQVLDKAAPRTANRMLSTVKKFMKFLIQDKGLLQHSYVATMEGHKVDHNDSPYVALEDAQVLAMVAACDTRTHLGATQRLAFVLSFYLGLRVSELVGLRHADLDRGVLTVRGKGSKVRRVPLPETLVDEILAYTAMTVGHWGAVGPQDPLLTTRESVRMTSLGKLGYHQVDTSTVGRWYTSVAAAVGIQGRISPHCARCTAITKALDSGVSIRDVAILAGHSSIETTVIYDKRRGTASKVAAAGIKY